MTKYDGNPSPLADGLRELLAQWDSGEMTRGEFEAKVDGLVRPEDDALKIRIGSNVSADEQHPLADGVREVLTQWVRGELYRAAFEAKMREVICHFAKVYLPIDADLEKLKLVGKLAYQFKFRMQSVFIGGTQITPFWDAIDDLPTNLLNEAYAEMKRTEEAEKTR